MYFLHMNLYFGVTSLLERLLIYVVTADAAVARGGIQERHTTHATEIKTLMELKKNCLEKK